MAASFRSRVVKDLVEKLFCCARDAKARRVLLSGGVSRNSLLRRLALHQGGLAGIEVVIPDPAYCSDNAAMVAALGTLKFRRGQRSSFALDAFATMSDLV